MKAILQKYPFGTSYNSSKEQAKYKKITKKRKNVSRFSRKKHKIRQDEKVPTQVEGVYTYMEKTPVAAASPIPNILAAARFWLQIHIIQLGRCEILLLNRNK